jgi:hypothetical protein
MKSLLVGIKNVLLWSYARGTWQYDALCLLIVLTVFLVPGSFFGDRDRAKQTSANETEGAAPKAGEIYVGDAEFHDFLRRQNQVEQTENLNEAMRLYLRDRLGKEVAIDEVEHFTSSDGKLIYRVRFK